MGIESRGYTPKEAMNGHEAGKIVEFSFSGDAVLPALHEMTLRAEADVDLRPDLNGEFSPWSENKRLDAIRLGLDSADLTDKQKEWAQGKITEAQEHIDRWSTKSSM